MHLILYSKVGCHLCENLEAKLRSISTPQFDLEIREIATNPDWWDAFQYEIPVLHLVTTQGDVPLPRISPRAPLSQLQQILAKSLAENEAQ
jgi:Glutaredoxin-like domain (DUF836)